MACRDTVGRGRRACVEWEERQRRVCRDWRTESERRCNEWEEQSERRCTQHHEETERVCDRWEEERSKECSDWNPLFRWLCIAWTWVTTTVCRVWSWVTTTVCDIWTWVTTTVCRAWVWITTTVCTLWVIVSTFVCRTWVFILEIWCGIVCWFKRVFAPNEYWELKTECIYGWKSAYRADLDLKTCTLKITLRIRLVPDDDVTEADLANVRALWEPAIEGAWSGQFPIMRQDGSCTCERYTVSVDVQFVDSNEHHAVAVHSGGGRADMTNWYVNSSGGTASHESGHMFGNIDEYADDSCPDRVVTSDGSIMRNSRTGSVKERHYESFQRWVSNRTCCEYTV